MDTGNKSTNFMSLDKWGAEASEANTTCKWKTGELQSGWANIRWTFYRLLSLEETVVVHRPFSRLAGLQVVWPTILCCTFTSVSITTVCVGTTAPGTAAQLPVFFTFHYSYLYTAWNTGSLTTALIFGVLTEVLSCSLSWSLSCIEWSSDLQFPFWRSAASKPFLIFY